MDTDTTISITFQLHNLTGYTDEYLAMLWHLAQANPADGFEHSEPGEIAEKIGREIIHRWLQAAPVALWHHQGEHYKGHQLRKFATYSPPPGVTGGPQWHNGTWSLRPEAVTAAAPTDSEATAPAAGEGR